MDRAKTVAQKKQVMKRLYKLWLENPELRLTQLMENVYHHVSNDHCFYYVEDIPFLDSLEQYYSKKKQPSN